MHYSMYIVPVLLPVLFWAGYHYYKDRHLPEPLGHLLLAFVLGIASFWLGKLMYFGLGLVDLRFDAYVLAARNPIGLFFYAVLAIGVIEELAKMVFSLRWGATFAYRSLFQSMRSAIASITRSQSLSSSRCCS